MRPSMNVRETTLVALFALVSACDLFPVADDDDDDDDDDKPATVTIEEIQGGEVSEGDVVKVGPVLVTATRTAATGTVNFWIESAEGSSPTWPQLGGMQVFVGDEEVADLDVSLVAALACLRVTGEVTEFHGATELTRVESLVAAEGCDASIDAFGVTVEQIGQDIDPLAAGNQPGPLVDAFEGTLVTVSNVTVESASGTGDFTVTDGNGHNLTISDFVVGSPLLATVGQAFSSITGVLTRFDQNVLLQPRDAADLE